MPQLRLLPLGVGDAFTAEHYTASYALGLDDAWLLIDCSHPVRKMLREASRAARLPVPLDLDQVVGTVITHLHADHCCGLEDLGFYAYYALGRRAPILAHPAVAENLWTGLLSAGMSQTWLDRYPSTSTPPTPRRFDEFFDLQPLNVEAPVTFGPFAIECRFTQHSLPTTALRIRAGGRTIGFSADSAFDPSLIAWLEPCDLIIHEVTSAHDSPVHTPYRHLAALPQPLRARTRLTHYPDDFDRDGSTIEPLRQGKIYPV